MLRASSSSLRQKMMKTTATRRLPDRTTWLLTQVSSGRGLGNPPCVESEGLRGDAHGKRRLDSAEGQEFHGNPYTRENENLPTRRRGAIRGSGAPGHGRLAITAPRQRARRLAERLPREFPPHMAARRERIERPFANLPGVGEATRASGAVHIDGDGGRVSSHEARDRPPIMAGGRGGGGPRCRAVAPPPAPRGGG